jgi:hypothetical protein
MIKWIIELKSLIKNKRANYLNKKLLIKYQKILEIKIKKE